MLTLGRFKALVDAYGAKPQRWPEAVRGDAGAFLDRSDEARRLLADAQAVDEAISAAHAAEDARLWPAGAQSAALARLRAGVAGRIAAVPDRRPRGWLSGWLSERIPAPTGPKAHAVTLGWVGLATGSGFAIVAGLLIGLMSAPVPVGPGNLLTMLQLAPLQILVD